MTTGRITATHGWYSILLYNGPPFPSLKIAMGRSGPYMILWAHRVLNLNGISVGSAVFAGPIL